MLRLNLYGQTGTVIDGRGSQVFRLDSAEMLIKDAEIINGATAGIDHGGCIRASSSKVTLEGVAVRNCNSTGYGGGIAMLGHESITVLSDSTNQPTSAHGSGSLVVKRGSMITDCFAEDGGAIASHSLATTTTDSPFQSGSQVSLEGSARGNSDTSIRNCHATNAGGAIFGAASLSDSTIEDCTAGERGGAMVLAGSGGQRPLVVRSIVRRCFAKSGGAINIGESARFQAEMTRIEECVAEQGGALWIHETSQTVLEEVTLHSNAATLDHPSLQPPTYDRTPAAAQGQCDNPRPCGNGAEGAAVYWTYEEGRSRVNFFQADALTIVRG